MIYILILSRFVCSVVVSLTASVEEQVKQEKQLRAALKKLWCAR